MKIMNVFKGVWKDEPPCNHYDIPAMEKWLEEQARNGRQFKAWPNRFDAAEPCDCRFSIQPVPENEWKGPAPERLEAYREAGWEYGLQRLLGLALHPSRPGGAEHRPGGRQLRLSVPLEGAALAQCPVPGHLAGC